MERNGLSNFCEGPAKEHACVIISKMHPLVREQESFEGFSILSSGGHFVQRSGTV